MIANELYYEYIGIRQPIGKDTIIEFAKKFATLHVEAALKAAKAGAETKWHSDMRMTGYGYHYVEIGDYPLTNIK